ncbi:MAG: SDR family NAD(P)-dependent oxidoreductase, partial [Leptolyngbya sp. SIO1D8]|nr:SDR family NAD(P)-dependent oxidoreductase [Leptolyngbya sp. SIO1D8]
LCWRSDRRQLRRELIRLCDTTATAGSRGGGDGSHLQASQRLGAVRESQKHTKLDVLINNAGVYSVSNPMTQDSLDIRFVVNAIAPYLLTQQLLPLLGASGRVINVSSAAQSPVDPDALAGRTQLSEDFTAYGQSKLALTMWSRVLALKADSPVIVAVNPGSMLGSKMVKQAFGVAGGDIRIGAEILTRAALSDEFATASGQYFDNDSGQFTSPHADALNPQKSAVIVHEIEAVLAAISQSR